MSVSKEKLVTSRRVSTTRKFSNFPWARENAGRTRSSPRPPSVPCRRRDRARSGRCYSIDADAFMATTFSAQQRRLFGIVRDDATASTQTRSLQRHSPRSSVAFLALSKCNMDPTVYASIDFEPPIASFKELLRPNREHFFLSSLHWKDQPLRIGSDYVHGAVAQAVSARAEHGQDAQAAPAVDTALDAPAHVTGVRVKLCVVAR